jgi:hypothetical protein
MTSPDGIHPFRQIKTGIQAELPFFSYIVTLPVFDNAGGLMLKYA